jgi:hypothetical protein
MHCIPEKYTIANEKRENAANVSSLDSAGAAAWGEPGKDRRLDAGFKYPFIADEIVPVFRPDSVLAKGSDTEFVFSQAGSAFSAPLREAREFS